MKQAQNYTLKKLDHSYYLLPYGQNIADLKRSLKLNETSVFLWDNLKEDISKEEIIAKAIAHYKINKENQKEVTDDIIKILNSLISLGAITDNKEEELLTYLNIADIIIKLNGSHKFFDDQFNFFKYKETSYDLEINVHPFYPNTKMNGNVLIRNQELVVMENEDNYIFLFPSLSNIYESYISKDGKVAHIFIENNTNEEAKLNLFYSIRIIFLYKAYLNNIFAIHSASILYKDKIWLFSGHSGMGKTTHTKLWNDFIKTPIINGDLNLITLNKNHAIVYGLPWCGTSNIAHNTRYKLGGIILLNKDLKNSIEELTSEKKILQISQRFISPIWKLDMLINTYNFSEKLIGNIFVTKLHCTKNKDAVLVIKNAIDEYLRSLK